jgi:hypothetical protein
MRVYTFWFRAERALEHPAEQPLGRGRRGAAPAGAGVLHNTSRPAGAGLGPGAAFPIAGPLAYPEGQVRF